MHRSVSLSLLAIACAIAVEDSPIIIVTAERGESELLRAPVSVAVVTERDIDRRGGANDMLDWFREMPGIGVFSKYGGLDGGVPDVRIRGLDSAYTQVLIDGIPVNDPTTINGDLNFAFLAPAGVERLEVVKGSQSGLYGSRAIGGVAGLRTIRPTDDHQTSASATYGSFATAGGQVRATGPLGDSLGYALAVEGMRSDGITSLTPDAHGDPGDWEADAVSRLSYSARIEAKLGAETTAHVAAMGSRVSQDLDDGYYQTVAPYAYQPELSANDPVAGNDITTNRFSGGVEHRGERLRLNTELAWSGSRRENSTIYGVNSYLGPDPITVDYHGRETYAAATARYLCGYGLSVMLGGDGRWQQASQDRSDTGSQWSEDERLLGVFAQTNWSNELCEIGLVGRHDDNSEFGAMQSGRVSGALFLVDGTLKLRGSTANGFRTPSLYERFGSENGSYPYVGNPDLAEERSISYEAGVDWDPADVLSLSATWFRTDFENKVTFDFSSFPSTMTNLAGRSESSGVEVGAQLRDIGGSGIDVASDYTGMATADPDGDELAYAPNHRGGVRVTATQQATGRISVWQTVRVERLTAYYTGGNETGRVDGYTLASAAVGATLDQRYEASLRIENLTDEDYVVTSSFGQTYATMPRAYYATVKARF